MTQQPPRQLSYEAWNRFFAPFMNYTLPTGQKERDEAEQLWLTFLEQSWRTYPFSTVPPFDPLEVSSVFQALWLDTLRHPEQIWARSLDFSYRYTQLLTATTYKFWGQNPPLPAVISPEKGDKRFSAREWDLYPAFNFLKQSYLLTSATLLKAASERKGLTAQQQRKLIFYLRQFLDAISPSNLLFTNPQVLQETVQSGGQNLLRGMEHLLRDMQSGQVKITDTDAFTLGRNLAITPGQVVYRNQLIELIQYAPSTPEVYTIPLLLLPPWINKYYILDLQPQNSLVKYLVDQGYTVFVVSWKNPNASLEETTFEDYLTQGLLAALDVVKEITASPQVHPVGYCIGGTLLSMALSYLQARGDQTVNCATFLVTLLDFREVGDTAVFMDEYQISSVEQQMRREGYLPSQSMASMFNLLRANDLIWSNVVNNYLLGKEPPAFDLLYWNNDGTRMAPAAHSFYLRNTYLENNLMKPNKIVLRGVPIDLGRIQQEIYAVGTEQDHIVPWQAAWRILQLVSGPVRFVLAGSGHVAGIISPPDKGRGYRTNEQRAENAQAWLAGATAQEGSWWTDWVNWLSARSGGRKEAQPVGNAAYPPITPAPGTYVLEK